MSFQFAFQVEAVSGLIGERRPVVLSDCEDKELHRIFGYWPTNKILTLIVV
jgi:hypothetical protein